MLIVCYSERHVLSSTPTYQCLAMEIKGSWDQPKFCYTPHGIISKSRGWQALTLVSFLYCHLSYAGFTPKAKEMMALPLTVGFEETLLLMLQLLIYAKHVSVQQHDNVRSAAALVSLINCLRASY